MAMTIEATGDPRIGLLLVGLGGAVATTVAAGLERIRQGSGDRAGLPLAALGDAGLADYGQIEVAGWDLNPDDLATAASRHRVVPPEMLAAVEDGLSAIRPWAGSGNTAFCRNVSGDNITRANSHLGAVEQVRQDIAAHRLRTGLSRLVMVNLASVESWPDDTAAYATPERFERALQDNDPSISPTRRPLRSTGV